MEFDALNSECMIGNRESGSLIDANDALIGDIMHGHDRGRARAIPFQVCRRQAAWPIVRVDHIRYPAEAPTALSDFSSGQRQSGEADMIVGPIASLGTGVNGARPI